MELKSFTILALALLSTFCIIQSEAQLSTTFYDRSCPNAASIIRRSIGQAIARERRMAASLIRLHFHDCFIQGCDASILLDETPTILSEKNARPNLNSVRGYEVIEAAKAAVESACPGIVSCADIVTLAARDASVYVGGPTWTPRLGRRDSTTANQAQANNGGLPGPNDSLDTLTSSFANLGLNTRDLVALSGSHTLGQSQCFLFRDRIYNATDIDANFASTRRRQCPRTGGNSNLAPLDLVTPNSFDNNYFRNLVQRRGLLQSDQVLFSGAATSSIVNEYARTPRTFAADFATAMIRMGEIQPTLGQNGIIRRVCTAIN